jgi:predicted ATPase/transcriptional regulator with XRE-family HTH domain
MSTETDPTTFGHLLRRYRQAAALSQEALAGRAGLSVQAVGQLERGDRRAPRLETVRLLAAALQLDAAARATLLAAARPDVGISAPAAVSPEPDSEPPTTLPVPLSPLIGREREAAAAHVLLHEGVRLLTLTGPGGVGKTRLALRVAAMVRPAFPGGVIFVDLAPLRDPNLVLPTIAQRLGVTEAGGQALDVRMAAALADRQVLLFLDNFEQVVVAAPVVVELAARSPHLTVLVTSRVSLQVRGEHAMEVPPLAIPDPAHLPAPSRLTQVASVALFVARAREVRADFVLGSASGAAVAEICARLDGLPLAIELAASWVKLLPPPALLRRLFPRLGLLVGGARDLPERQRTVRATIDWSYSLLRDDEQVLFARLSVFRGGGTLEAIEAICGAEGRLNVLKGVGVLVNHSLLRQTETDDEGRFGMLETIQEYAAEQLETRGEGEFLRQAHARYYLGLAEVAKPRLDGPEQAAWLARLGWEIDNLRAALGRLFDQGEGEQGLHLAATLLGFWHARCHFSEGRGWLEAGLAMAGSVAVPVRLTALQAAARLAMVQGDQVRTTTLLEELLPLARAQGDRRQTGQALALLGMTAVQRGAHAEGARYLEESLSSARTQGSRFDLAQALYNVGLAKSEAGNYMEAGTLIEEAHGMFEELGHTFWRMNAVGTLGYICLLREDHGRAHGLLAGYLVLARQLRDKANSAAGLEGLAVLAGAAGQGQHAARLFAAAQRLREEIGGRLMSLRNRTLIEGGMSDTRMQVGDDAWSIAWDAGRMLTTDQAIAAALEDTITETEGRTRRRS